MSTTTMSVPAHRVGWGRALPLTLDNTWVITGILALWCGVLFFYGIQAGELYRTEGLRAIIARDMMRSGDWLVPRLYGQPIFTKPPGMYIAIVLCSWPFGGVTAWTARLPSALAASATVLLFFGYFQRMLGRRAGLLAALVLPASALWLDKASAAEIDMLQVAWVSAAILFFLRALDGEDGGGSSEHGFGWWLGALLCVAGGTLTKWTAPAFFYCTAIPLLCWRGQWRLLYGWRHLSSAFIGAILVLAWIAYAVQQTSWNFFYDQVSQEALHRLVPGATQRGYPWLEVLVHPALVLAIALPWSAVAITGIWHLFKERRMVEGSISWARASAGGEPARRVAQAMHCWVWPNLLFWSLHNEHTLRNRAPLLPGIAGLAVVAMIHLGQRWRLGGRVKRQAWLANLRRNRLFLGFLAVWLLAKVAYVEGVVPRRDSQRRLREKAMQIVDAASTVKCFSIFRIKDESLMFYVDRPVVRFDNPSQLQQGHGTCCILTAKEWQGWAGPAARMLSELTDGQGDRIFVVELY